jgi:hypothetical protein
VLAQRGVGGAVESLQLIESVKMVVFRYVFAAAACAAQVLGVDIIVKSAGGNETGKFGHPFGYGFLHEVRTLHGCANMVYVVHGIDILR